MISNVLQLICKVVRKVKKIIPTEIELHDININRASLTEIKKTIFTKYD